MNYIMANGKEINKDNMEPKESKSKKHFKVSIFKSGIRMLGCSALILGSIFAAGCLLFIAECLGVVEEL